MHDQDSFFVGIMPVFEMLEDNCRQWDVKLKSN